MACCRAAVSQIAPRVWCRSQKDEGFRAILGSTEEASMTLTILDPRSGQQVIITVPNVPPSSMRQG